VFCWSPELVSWGWCVDYIWFFENCLWSDALRARNGSDTGYDSLTPSCSVSTILQLGLW